MNYYGLIDEVGSGGMRAQNGVRKRQGNVDH